MEKLIFVAKIGKNSDDNYEYDFYFCDGNISEYDVTQLDGWQCEFAAQDEIEIPSLKFAHIKRLITKIPFICAQDNTCYSMQDAVNNIIALSYEDISEYDEYPEPIRLVFQYNEEYDSVINKLEQRNEAFI